MKSGKKFSITKLVGKQTEIEKLTYNKVCKPTNLRNIFLIKSVDEQIRSGKLINL